MSFGNRLKLLRNKKNINQTELAKYLNMGQGAVSKWELDESQPDFETLKKIADYFEVTVDYLLERTNIPYSNYDIDFIEDIHLSDDELMKKYDLTKSYGLKLSDKEIKMLLKLIRSISEEINM